MEKPITKGPIPLEGRQHALTRLFLSSIYPIVYIHLKATQAFGVLTCGDDAEGTLDD
jgi:hypothetical protein